MAKITVQNTQITVIKQNEDDYISLTDMLKAMLKAKDGEFFFSNWLRNRNTIEFLGIWERLMNPNFNCAEFDIIKHKDIAFEFAMWISPEFKVYLIREFQRLKDEEQKQLGWTAKRELSKINYRIHTDAIKQNLIPEEVTQAQASIIYAEEADVLNVAMFGQTAKQWREAHPELKGNIRDYASINELICLANMENINAVLIDEGVPQGDRLVRLNQIAINQMRVLENDDNRNLLK